MAQIATAKADDVSDAADVLRLCVAFRRGGVAAHSGRLVALLRGAREHGCPAFVNTEESITISLACAHFLADVPLTPAEKWADAVGDDVNSGPLWRQSKRLCALPSSRRIMCASHTPSFG